ncbi:MAG: hypothetical protein M3159_06690 [Actinomycetota bacterium]|nr:hypothetical protein [Actinomycetota bacterium]
MKRVVAYVPDLMDRSKVAAAGDVSFVTDPARLGAEAEGADIVLVDLTRAGVLDALPSIGAPVIGFANHTQRELLDAARAAGCVEALPRSAFFSRLDELVGGN